MPGWASFLGLEDVKGSAVAVTDATVAAAAVIALFVLPAKRSVESQVVSIVW